jgi:hypothetical protein
VGNGWMKFNAKTPGFKDARMKNPENNFIFFASFAPLRLCVKIGT